MWIERNLIERFYYEQQHQNGAPARADLDKLTGAKREPTEGPRGPRPKTLSMKFSQASLVGKGRGGLMESATMGLKEK